MSRSLLIGACLVLSCIVLGVFIGSPSAGQSTEVSSSVGQFQLVVAGSEAVVDDLYVLNTQTGHCWWRDNQAKKWVFLGTPVTTAEKK
jgi:hypothetical protein